MPNIVVSCAVLHIICEIYGNHCSQECIVEESSSDSISLPSHVQAEVKELVRMGPVLFNMHWK